MFVPVRIDVNEGQAVYHRGFDLLERQAANMSIPLSEIGGRLIEDVGAQFGSEGSWSGNPWKPLSPTYEAWKNAHAPGAPLLVGVAPGGGESGRMRSELLDPGSVMVTPKRMVYAPVSNIAGFHQTGTSKMPARPPVEVPPTELRQFDRIFARWINGLINQTGLIG